MYKKKIIGIALIAAMVSSMAAVSASARDAFDDGEIDTYTENHTFGIVGAMTDWGGQPDVAMTDPDGDGIYVGIYKDLAAGTYAFKVRADSNWDDSWGVYEAEYERTMNSQTDCSITVEGTTDLIVTLDTNGDDEVVWPVSFFTTDSKEESKYGICGLFTGWGGDPDAPMYEYAEGKYVGIVKDVAAGDYAFKVRADSDWVESYGVYEEDYDRTNNSQTDCAMTIEADEEKGDLIVFFDTTGDDDQIWPVSWSVITPVSVLNVYSGKFVEEEEPVSEEPSEIINPLTPSKYGIVGSMTGWGETDDYPMFETETGVFEGVTSVLPAGDYQFKVRADSDWAESYGVYEADYDRTNNSQTDIGITLSEDAAITVKLDTTGDDDQIWPVSYKIGEGEWVYTGKPVEEEPVVSEEPVSEPVSEPSETSVPVEEPSETSEPEFYETKVTDYVYFDNSETKWDEVYAYWWDSDYARTYDLEGNDWGIVKTTNPETGAEGWEPVKFPGTKMTQIEGTDIWQARVPFEADFIIFSSGKSDEQVQAGEIGYQTADLKFDPIANAGQIYVVDAKPTTDNPNDKKANPTPGRGIEKTKYKYNVGAWEDYTAYAAAKGVEAKFMSEIIGEVPQQSDVSKPTDTTSTPDNTTSKPVDTNGGNNNGGTNNGTNNGSSNNNGRTSTPVSTGDATMPVAVAAVAVLALGTAVLASRKKVEE